MLDLLTLTAKDFTDAAEKTGVRLIARDGYRTVGRPCGCPLVVLAISRGHKPSPGMKAADKAAAFLGIPHLEACSFILGIDGSRSPSPKDDGRYYKVNEHGYHIGRELDL